MVLDEWPVIAEDFNQWVVEDNFCCGCPDWDKVLHTMNTAIIQ
jgi:mannitol 2-dehydrogenase